MHCFSGLATSSRACFSGAAPASSSAPWTSESLRAALPGALPSIMLGKLPLGVVSPYVKMSSGGSMDPLQFYATSYCTSYGREEFKPRVGTHMGTGYKSNYRPIVSHQANLDAPENPAMEEQIRDNLQTATSPSYRPLEVPDGKFPVSWNPYQASSGYGREKPNTGPTTKEVRKVHFDTQEHGPQAIAGLEPKAMPLLHQPQSKGSLEWENWRHGPRFMTSEYNSKYLKEPSNQPDLLQKKSIGAKEDTGYTEQSTKNPIVFQPPSQATPGDPGDEFLPVLSRGSERETSFSRVNERTLNPRVPPSGVEPSSMNHWQFQNPQRMQQTNVAMLGRETVGKKEPTGFSLNNPSYVRSPYDSDRDNRYLTTYNQGYFENIPKGLDREGWTRGGIQPQMSSGYVLNQPVTRMEATPNPTESLRRLHPHVGRTLTSVDPFYRDTPHSSRFMAPS
ncbi:protein phosphatase 1 regulatory subunit 32 isoform X2 [Tupaia chinensis]|uniref:protein phosphatase 1 regulatory subunit 32 isoform X2 n=1 Tax=Tupaia chinensis TaxID=246437 RepID=UPI0003C90370|nr:protein phosphatase 1 regulatory subunit 32 isoform X2 [Tupaia chinensis]